MRPNYNFFKESVPLLWSCRWAIFENPDYFWAELETGFPASGMLYNLDGRKVCLGVWLKAVEENPSLMTVPSPRGGCDCREPFLVTGSVGSPLSGCSSTTGVCPRCGLMHTFKDSGHNQRMQYLNRIIDRENSVEHRSGKSLQTVVKELQELGNEGENENNQKKSK